MCEIIFIGILQDNKTKEILNKKKDETSFTYLNNSLEDLYELEVIFWQKISDIIWNIYFNFISIEFFGDEFYKFYYKKYKQFLLLDFDFDNNKLIYNYPEYSLDYLYGKGMSYNLINLEIIKDNLNFFNLNLLLNFRFFWENHYYFWNKLNVNVWKYNLLFKKLVYILPIFWIKSYYKIFLNIKLKKQIIFFYNKNLFIIKKIIIYLNII